MSNFTARNVWPTNVSCEMNVHNWSHALREHNLYDKYNYVIEGFKTGFHQGIPSHSLDGVEWFTPPNHASAAETMEKIKADLVKEVSA